MKRAPATAPADVSSTSRGRGNKRARVSIGEEGEKAVKKSFVAYTILQISLFDFTDFAV